MITQDVKDNICNNYLNGLNQHNLAMQYHISRPTVRKILKEAKVWKPQQKKNVLDIIADYQSDMLMEDVCTKHQISPRYLYNVLNKHHITLRTTCIKDMTNDFICIIIDEYMNQHISILQIANNHHIATQTVRHILIQNNVQIVEKTDLYNNPMFNNRYFEKIDTPNKAYWLGWLITDGGVYNNHIQFRLQPQDVYILHLLQNDLQLTDKISMIQGYANFSIGSKTMCDDLVQYGIIPNKTHNITFPDNIPTNLIHHFIRGCFDGDGGLTVSTRQDTHQYYCELSFTGTKHMVEGFKNVLVDNTDITNKKIERNASMYRVRWSSKSDCKTILNYLYTDANDHKLPRKYDKYLLL